MPHRVQTLLAPHWMKPKPSKMLEKNLSDVFQIHPSKRKKTYHGLKNVRANSSYYSYPNLFIPYKMFFTLWSHLFQFLSLRERERERYSLPFFRGTYPTPSFTHNFPTWMPPQLNSEKCNQQERKESEVPTCSWLSRFSCWCFNSDHSASVKQGSTAWPWRCSFWLFNLLNWAVKASVFCRRSA